MLSKRLPCSGAGECGYHKAQCWHSEPHESNRCGGVSGGWSWCEKALLNVRCLKNTTSEEEVDDPQS
jgi:hypothetical protein